MKLFALVAAMLVAPTMSSAQQPTDPKWGAWLGCWELVLESAQDGLTRPNPARRTLPQTPASSRPQICVEPSGGGVSLTTRVANQSALQQTIVADGADHPITDAECRGTQRAGWSSDGRKLYSRADLTCSNDKGNRRVSGFSILGANGTWTDIQAVDVSGQQTVRVRNYRRVGETTTIGRGRTHATALTLDDVKEAASQVSPRALEAALVETGSSFDVTGKDLLSLQAATVPGSVTDLIVALSYPDRFVVERQARADVAPTTLISDDPFFLGWAFGYPTWYDFGFYSPLYGPYSPYFYSPFYAYLPWYYPPYYGGGGSVIIGDGGGSGGGVRPQPSGAGRVVDGLGYTRVRPREVEPTPTSPVRSGAGSVASSSGSSSSSSGGSGSVSSQGFSSGGSGGGDSGGGRTAQPR